MLRLCYHCLQIQDMLGSEWRTLSRKCEASSPKTRGLEFALYLRICRPSMLRLIFNISSQQRRVVERYHSLSYLNKARRRIQGLDTRSTFCLHVSGPTPNLQQCTSHVLTNWRQKRRSAKDNLVHEVLQSMNLKFKVICTHTFGSLRTFQLSPNCKIGKSKNSL